MPPRENHVFHLRAHGGWQHKVCVGGGISNKMVCHDGKQIFALQAFNNFVRFGRLCDRIRVPNHNGFNRYI